MSLLLKTERAFSLWLRGQTGQLITGTGTYVETDKGIRIRLYSGSQFSFLALRGQDEVERIAPCVVCYCASGLKTEVCTTTAIVDVEITLYFPADKDMAQIITLSGFEYAAEKLGEALLREDLIERINEITQPEMPEFTLLHGVGNWAEESGWEGRLRTYTYRRQYQAAPVNLRPTPL
jgi:hypothetical protein